MKKTNTDRFITLPLGNELYPQIAIYSGLCMRPILYAWKEDKIQRDDVVNN